MSDILVPEVAQQVNIKHKEGLQLAKEKQPEVALGVYDEAIKIAGGDAGLTAWVRFDKGKTLISLGRFDEALKEFEQAKDPLGENTWVYTEIGNAHIGLKKLTAAEQEYAHALKINENNWEAADGLKRISQMKKQSERLHVEGVQKFENGDTSGALTAYQQAIQEVGVENAPWSVFDLGKVLTSLGRYDEAKAAFLQSKALLPNVPWPDVELKKLEKQIKHSESAEVLKREYIATVEYRRMEAERLAREGKTRQQIIEYFDNDYSSLEAYYKVRVGVDLVTDPYESSEHEIPITKKLSIVIPTYNNSERLKQCLLAIQASSFNAKYPQNLEVVVVDDGSTKENISEAVQSMDFQDLNIKVYRQSNGKAAKAIYSGVLQATGDVVMINAPDTVNTTTYIEEYMKRHEVLDQAVFFGFRDDIYSNDDRLKPENIANGSLGQLGFNFHHDSRVMREGMVESEWMKLGGHDKLLPIDTDSDWYVWRAYNVAWGLSMSAPRDALIKVFAGWDEGYKGYGYDDEDCVSGLMAQGYYVIPNSAGMVYHQWHESRRGEGTDDAKIVFERNLNLPPRTQDINNPKLTDAALQYESHNTRTDRKDPIGVPHVEPIERAKLLMTMGLYEKALEAYNQAEATHSDEYWFMHDKAKVLTALGGEKNLAQAISYLEKVVGMDASVTWVYSTLAIAYGRAGYYDKARGEYEEALRIDPNNHEAKIIANDINPFKAAENLHFQASEYYLKRGRPREALKFYEAALALVGEEGSPWSLFDKGKALMELGRYDDAVKVLERTRELMPHETWPDSQLALVYEKWSKSDLAQIYYNSALSKDPDNQEALHGLARLDIGLLSWDQFEGRRSERILADHQAKLDEQIEVHDYLRTRNPQYLEELRTMDAMIASPMSEKCRAAICLPALEEGRTIRNTLEIFLQQEGIDFDEFEIIIFDNHKSSIKKDKTESEIRAFQIEHPEMKVHYIEKVWQKGEASIGNARRYVTDIALMRDSKRNSQTGDLILISGDVDMDFISKNYISNYIHEFDENPNIDVATGKWDLPEDALNKPNLKIAQRLWYILDRVVARDAVGLPSERNEDVVRTIGRNSAMRASIYAAVGGYNERAKLAEDLEIGWMINSARSIKEGQSERWDPKRSKYVSGSEVVTNARRFLAAMVQGIPLYNMYGNFDENREVRLLNNEDLLNKIPDELQMDRLELDVNALWDAGKAGQYTYLGRKKFAQLFTRAMGLSKIPFRVEDGHIRLIHPSESDQQTPPFVDAETQYDEAKALMFAGSYKQALEVFNKVETYYPNDYWFMHDKASALIEVGGERNVHMAINYLTRVIRQNSQQTWVHSALALAYGRIGEYDKARGEYEEALRLNPDNWQAQGIKLTGGETPQQKADYWHSEAQKKLKEGDYREAIRYNEFALILAGEGIQPWSLFDKGKALAALGLYADAIKAIDRTREILPHETWPYSQLGVIYEQMGMKEEAKKYYDLALSKLGDNQEALAGLQRL